VRAAAAALLLFALAGRAGAHHADLVRSEPAGGAPVAAPEEVRAWFNQPLVVPGSGLAVTDAAGGRVDDGQSRRVDGDPHSLAVRLLDTPPGAYTVTWRVTAETDLDYAQGSFGFEVAARRDGWLAREGMLALGLGLLSLAVVRAARPAAPAARAALAARVTQTNSELEQTVPRSQRVKRVLETADAINGELTE
jgi:methionine-rich copper-binding protein CopC